MNVALYARVSTTQHHQDVETQLQALRLHAKARRWTIVDIYADKGWSGSKERRPELDRLMKDASRRRFDAVMVARFDRFARSVKHLLSALDTFQAIGIDFISLTENIDTSTPMGRMVFTVLAAVAELERSLIRERVRMGLDRARRQGTPLGRRRRLTEEDEQVIAKEVKKGIHSIRALARQWGFARSSIREIAKRQQGPGLRRGADRRQIEEAGRAGRRLRAERRR
jgi:DNA invertase Pin-like site-specific DNA recombinase